ncbi:MAG: putative zinc-binding metallopeptidase [Hyphomonadaceae bacterium]
MKRFECPNCSQPLFFESRACDSCGRRLGYLPMARTFLAAPEGADEWRDGAGGVHRMCANAAFEACTWLVPPESDSRYCIACRHNRFVPNLAFPENVARWRKIEAAKHRLFYSLLRLGLPLTSNLEARGGLAFDFLLEIDGAPVMTGHQDGLITINILEADDDARERQRNALEEPYRTLLGHFRHEVAHYYWDQLLAAQPRAFRAVFGDERQDYAAALGAHYANGPPPDWSERFVTPYAAAHPWEDFAETWAHYLHMVDTLETAGAFGVSMRFPARRGKRIDATVRFDPYAKVRLETLIDSWLPLTYSINSINRSMGQPDLYPFAPSPAVVDKLAFVHSLIHGRAAEAGATRRAAASSVRLRPANPAGA